MQEMDERVPGADSKHGQSRSDGPEPVPRKDKERKRDINKNIQFTWQFLSCIQGYLSHRVIMHTCIHAYMYKIKPFPPREMQSMYTVSMIKFDLMVIATLLLQILQCYSIYMHTFLTNYDFHRKCC